jgi:hypothetical protein
LTTVTQIETAPILMDLSCALVIVYLKETKLFAKINRNFFISQNEAIWLAEEPFGAGRFFASGSLWNANARSGFRGKKLAVKQILNE